MLFLKVGIGIFVFSDNRFANLIEKRTVDSEQLSVACGTAKKTAKNISAAFVRGHYTVAYHEGRASDMVGYNAKGDVALFAGVILNTGNINNVLHNIADGIDFKEVIYALHDAGKPFKAHTGIDIAAFEVGVVALSVIVKLRENKVPEFCITVAVAARSAIRRAAAVFFAAVKVDFRTRAAGACSVFPEVILFSEPDDSL